MKSGMITFRIWIVAATAVLSACAPSLWQCQSGEDLAVVDSLYFGTNTPDGRIAPAQWEAFVAEAITPRFPEGFTSWQAKGQWQNRAGELEQEESYVVVIVHPGSPGSEAGIDAMIASYKARFDQEAVLRVRSRGCVSF